MQADPQASSAPNAEREWCNECTADLEIDASSERWACRPCGSWGTYAIAPNGWRVRVVQGKRTTVVLPQAQRARRTA